jgi:hypothetical protein
MGFAASSERIATVADRCRHYGKVSVFPSRTTVAVSEP